MRKFNRGVWEDVESIFPESYKSVEAEIEKLGFSAKTQLGKGFDLHVTYWSRWNKDLGYMDFIADFGTGDFGEDIYIPDIPSLIMFLKEMTQIGLISPPEKSYATFHTSDFDKVERAISNDFEGAKKIHYQVSSGGNDAYDMHYIIAEY